MSGTQKEQYEKDMAAYNTEYAEWSRKFNAFNDAMNAVRNSGISFSFNNVFLSGDGKMGAMTGTRTVDDPDSFMGFREEAIPYFFSFGEETRWVEYAQPSDINLSAITADGSLLGYRKVETKPERAYILPIGKTEFMPLEEYVTTKNAALGTWFTETMTREIPMYDEEGIVMKKFVVTGYPFASSDLSVIGGYTYNYWDEDMTITAFSYLFDINVDPNGVESPMINDSSIVEALKGGAIEVTGPADIAITGIDGTTRFEGKSLSGRVDTGLENGIYIIKATNAAGKTTVKKITF